VLGGTLTARLTRVMDRRAATQQPRGAKTFFEVMPPVSVPDPSREQLRKEIETAIGGPLGHEEADHFRPAYPLATFSFCEMDDDSWPCTPVTAAVDGVMQHVDELFTRARKMREAAEEMACNVESLTSDLDAAGSTNETLLKLVRARDAQIIELTAAVAEKEAQRARLKKLYSDTHRELNLLHDAYDGDADDEEFCARCAAGVDSSEHHAKCVVAGHALDGESASPLGVEGGAFAMRSTDRAMQVQRETTEAAESLGATIPQAVIDNNPAVAAMLGFVGNYQPGDLQRAITTERGDGR
jgi:hypothetical protein